MFYFEIKNGVTDEFFINMDRVIYYLCIFIVIAFECGLQIAL